MAKNLLLEIDLKEMPAHIVTPSHIRLEERVIKFLDEHHLDYETVQSFTTPRRLAMKVTAVPEEQTDVEKKVEGPAKKVASDAEGNWSEVAQGFVRSQRVTTRGIVFKELNGVEYVYVTKFTKDRSTKEVLTKLNDVITSLAFPVTIHWTNCDFEYTHPVHWIVALLDNEVIPFKVLGVTAEQTSRGRRFLGDDVTFQHANEYEAKLREQFVVVQPNERKQMIIDQANTLVAEKNWQLALDEELLEEVTSLVEYPTAFVGSFDEKYLFAPDEVLVTSMKEHQRCFEIRDDQGLLMPHLIVVRNEDNVHLENVIKGNERVLVACLEDAELFYNEDKKLTVRACVERLKNVTFHEKIGSIYGKMQRVTLIAQIIGRKVGLSKEGLEGLEHASEVYRFDLVANMAGEFPELQGIMGEEYALLQDEKPAVATATREHHLPTSSEDELPEAAVGTVLALAGRLDNVFSFFSAGMVPTGSNDPYALHRQTYGVIRIIKDKGWTFPLVQLQIEVNEAVNQDVEKYGVLPNEGQAEVAESVKACLRQSLMTKNARHDIIDTVVSAKQADLSKLFASANILRDRFGDRDSKPSMKVLTRVINLAKRGQRLLGGTEEGIDPSLLENKMEKELYQAVSDLSGAFATRAIAENYEALVNLRPLIDAYFSETMATARDEKVKQDRLKQLV